MFNIKFTFLFTFLAIALLIGCMEVPMNSEILPSLGTLESAQASISIGTSREMVIDLIPDGYWYHEDCGFSQGGGEDLFFYGSRDYDKAKMVIVRSERQGNGYQVSQIASFESYAWHTAYERCIDRHQFKETLQKQ